MENNSVYLIGTITTDFTYSHDVQGQQFYTSSIKVIRTSGTEDIIQLVAPEKVIDRSYCSLEGAVVEIQGEYRSYSRMVEGKNRLILQVFIREIELYNSDIRAEVNNSIHLKGFFCKPPVYRETPNGRHITDMMIVVNRSHGKSDYIPCLAWGMNALAASNWCVGTPVMLEGRIQSRKYIKRLEDGTGETRTANEVSCKWIDTWKDAEV